MVGKIRTGLENIDKILGPKLDRKPKSQYNPVPGIDKIYEPIKGVDKPYDLTPLDRDYPRFAGKKRRRDRD